MSKMGSSSVISCTSLSATMPERNMTKRLTFKPPQQLDVCAVNAMINSRVKRVKNIINHFHLLDSTRLNKRAFLDEVQEVKQLFCRFVSGRCVLRQNQCVPKQVCEHIEDNKFGKSVPRLEHDSLPVQHQTDTHKKIESEEKELREESATQEEEGDPGLVINFYLHHLLLFSLTPLRVKPPTNPEDEEKKSIEGKIRVVVTHINSLNSFFLQKYSSLEELNDLDNLIANRGSKKFGKEQFEIGGRTLGVACENKDSVYWKRGKLLDYSSKNGEILYEVFLIDYGNIEFATREKLREIDHHSMKCPPFAHECKLSHLDDDILNQNLNSQFLQIIDEKQLYTHAIPDGCNGIQEVELLIAAPEGDVLSVRDLLLKIPPPELISIL